MHKLGHTRSTNQRDHLLHTPDTFIRTVLPGMERATAVVHISPAAGAAFTQYTAELEPGGSLGLRLRPRGHNAAPANLHRQPRPRPQRLRQNRLRQYRHSSQTTLSEGVGCRV